LTTSLATAKKTWLLFSFCECPPRVRFEKIVQYTTHAATAAQEIADSAQIPFLAVAGALSLTILRGLEVSQDSKIPLIL
jgi:hypothetical protein